MKKSIAVFLTLTITLTLLAGCSSVNSTAGNSENTAVKAEANGTQTAQDEKNQTVNDNQNATAEDSTASANPAPSKPKVAVTPPEGWQEKEGAALAQYMKDTASFMVTCDMVPSGVKTPDEYVDFAKKEYKKAFADAEFSDTGKITVNGIEGRDYTFTTTVSGMKMKFRVVYLLKDSLAYTLTCSNFSDGFDAVASDYQAMIDSFKLQD